MHDACDGTCCAAFDVCDRTRDGAGSGNAAEKRHDKVGDALSHQLLIGIMAVIGHGIRNAGAKKTFDGAQKRNRDHRSDEVLEGFPREVGKRQIGKLLRNAAELRADCLNRKIENRDDNGGRNEHHDRAG